MQQVTMTLPEHVSRMVDLRAIVRNVNTVAQTLADSSSAIGPRGADYSESQLPGPGDDGNRKKQNTAARSVI
jgi:hypothetical protein